MANSFSLGYWVCDFIPGDSLSFEVSIQSTFEAPVRLDKTDADFYSHVGNSLFDELYPRWQSVYFDFIFIENRFRSDFY